MSFSDGIPSCSECQSEVCQGCVWLRLICEPDCESYGYCEYRNKPKIFRSNSEALRIYSVCLKHQALPDSGGVLDQSSKLMEMFGIIADEVAKQEKIKMESENKKNAN